jgi:MFS family permease
MQFGILSAIGQLSQVFQPVGSALTRKLTSRKGMVLKLCVFGRMLPLAIGVLPFLAARKEHAIWLFLALFFLSTSLLAVAGNMWIAWVSDIIPLRIRGRFFSLRSQYLMVAGLITGYAMGWFLDLFDSQADSAYSGFFKNIIGDESFFRMSHLPVAFFIVFSLGCVLGLAGLKYLKEQPEKPKIMENEKFVHMLFSPFKDRQFRRLLFYGIWWMLAVGIASPFWGPFMIKNLEMSLVRIQVYGTIGSITAFISLGFWGRFIDRFGNNAAMRIALILGGLNPMLWVVATADTYWIVYFEAMTSGIMWAGAGIVSTNFVLAIAPKAKSQIYSGVFGAFSGIAMMLTMLLSGALLPSPVDILNLHLCPEQVLFFVGGVARWSTLIPLFFITEPNAKPLNSPAFYFHTAASYLRAQGKQWFHRT